ncbi:hypothetical protein [Nocardioides aequoreus]|uniref:hypothetical protein n=1 Tax=Nocardioides aequoreus TaxID=397278 RepID=UPI0004C3E412|nr:hypothetical protein [Nocardioides aequoreus]
MREYHWRVEGDATSPGSTIVFSRTDDVELGRHTLKAVIHERVHVLLRSPGPSGAPLVAEAGFRVEPLGPGCRHVQLDFEASPPPTARPWAQPWRA